MLFTTILVSTLLGLRNAEHIGIGHEEHFTNELNTNENKNEVSKKQQYFEKKNENDVFNEGISNFLDQLGPKIIDYLGKRKPTNLDWWQKCIIYEIYPRSFKDTTGNGVGDLRGITEKIPYLKELGIGAVWLTPIYPSPGFDMGYDISDFKNIDQLMGTMFDFEELLNKLHENGIKIILDLVPNHTSHEHEWFIKSVQRIDPFTDYYVWADAKYVNGTRQPPNNWLTHDGECIWAWNEKRNQYYLHQFHEEQPDLNFWNPLVREEIKDVFRFWLDKGVDGFRLDAITYLYEKQNLLDMISPMDKNEIYGVVRGLNETFDELSTWRAVADEYKQKDGQTRVLIVESYESIENMMKFYGNSTHPGGHFPLNAMLLFLAKKPVTVYIEIISQLLSESSMDKWPSWTVGNHDVGRGINRFGDEVIDGIYMMQLLLPGTPVVYMADELGMPNVYLRDDQLIDSKSKKLGFSRARERIRTPFQWNSEAQAGFSNKTQTWLPVSPNYVTLNVEHQTHASRSHLKIFKQLIKLRQLDVFRSGDVKLYEVSKYVFAFSRSNNVFKSFFVVINMGSEMENVNLRKVNRFLPSKMTVRVASLNAEQYVGDVIETESCILRPSASLVLESSFF